MEILETPLTTATKPACHRVREIAKRREKEQGFRNKSLSGSVTSKGGMQLDENATVLIGGAPIGKGGNSKTQEDRREEAGLLSPRKKNP